MTNQKNIASVRHIADYLKDFELETELYAVWLSKNAVAEIAEAEKVWDEYREKVFPNAKESREQINEFDDVVIGVYRSREQAAFEKGMKAGARLMLELLGGGSND